MSPIYDGKDDSKREESTYLFHEKKLYSVVIFIKESVRHVSWRSSIFFLLILVMLILP